METWDQIQKRHKLEKINLMRTWAKFFSSVDVHQAEAARLLHINYKFLNDSLIKNNIEWEAKYEPGTKRSNEETNRVRSKTSRNRIKRRPETSKKINNCTKSRGFKKDIKYSPQEIILMKAWEQAAKLANERMRKHNGLRKANSWVSKDNKFS
jgi:hypothetical protein